MSGEKCRVLVTAKGPLVPADKAWCIRALEKRLRYYMDPEGRCYLPYDVAVRLGLCGGEETRDGGMGSKTTGHGMTTNPALRFMEILERLEKRGRGVRSSSLSLSNSTWKLIDDLARRLRKSRSVVAEALILLGLEAIGVRVEEEKAIQGSS